MFERFTDAARSAVTTAYQQAWELHAPTMAVEHLLLGVLTTSDSEIRELCAAHGLTAEAVRTALQHSATIDGLGSDDAAALQFIGIDLTAVRERLESIFGTGALDQTRPERAAPKRGRLRVSREAKKALELSLREAVAHGDRRIEAGHLMLGVLRAADEPTRQLVGDEDNQRELRHAVRDLLDKAA